MNNKSSDELAYGTKEIICGFHENAPSNDEARSKSYEIFLKKREELKALNETYNSAVCDVKLMKNKAEALQMEIECLKVDPLLSNSLKIEEREEIHFIIQDNIIKTEPNKGNEIEVNVSKAEAQSKFDVILARLVQKMKSNTGDVTKSSHESNTNNNDIMSTIKKSLSGNDIRNLKNFENIFKSFSLRRNNDINSKELDYDVRPSVICDNCKIYKDQLESLEYKLKAQYDDYNQLKNNHLEIEASNKELIDQLHNQVSEHEKSIVEMLEKYHNLNEFCDRLRSAYERFRESSDHELKTIFTDRRDVKIQITQIESAYENLLGIRGKKAAEMEAEKIDLPTDIEVAQFNLLSLKEEIIQLKSANEHLIEKMQSLEIFRKEKERADNAERDATFEEYNTDRSELQSKIEQLTVELNQTKINQTEFDQMENTVQILRVELDTIKANYSHLDTENQHLKKKCYSLQQDLENSESVQQDFVRLSQTLQIQLENIRQEEKELRWQFKEDINECNDCHLDLHGFNSRNKYNCRHCGKIFCKSCVSDIQIGANSRKAELCKICHTMLVKDAVPYFSVNNH